MSPAPAPPAAGPIPAAAISAAGPIAADGPIPAAGRTPAAAAGPQAGPPARPRAARPATPRLSGLDLARVRLAFLGAGFAVLWALMLVRTASVAGLIVRDASAAPMIATPGPVTSRASIIDRNGDLVALSVQTVAVGALPEKVRNPMRVALGLARVFPELDPLAIVGRLSSRSFVYLRQGLTPQQQQQVLGLQLPELEFRDTEKRRYPRGRLLSHVTGYARIDQVGVAGVEGRFNDWLNTATQPLQLTIDSRIQAVARDALQRGIDRFEAIGGSVVIMDVHTAELVAAVSLPDYDPNDPARERDNWFSRLTGSYEMGSTFKVFATAMALESGRWQTTDLLDTVSTLVIGRSVIKDDHRAGRRLTVAETLIESSNIGTVRMMEAVGRDHLVAFLKSTNLLDPLDAGFSKVPAPMVPARWSRISAATVSFGHGLSVSPIHLAAAFSAVVNGGVWRTPTIIRTPGLFPRVERRVLSQQTSDIMRKLLYLIPIHGTGTKARSEGYLIGGKTGTAEKLVPHPDTGKLYYSKRKDKNFVGFLAAFPMNAPRYVVLVNVDEPKPRKETAGRATGGWVAAPVVKEIVERMAPMVGVALVDEADPAIAAAMAVDWKTP